MIPTPKEAARKTRCRGTGCRREDVADKECRIFSPRTVPSRSVGTVRGEKMLEIDEPKKAGPERDLTTERRARKKCVRSVILRKKCDEA